MEKLRKPFQGVGNIIRFNWHFYLGVVLFCLLLVFIKYYFPSNLNSIFNFFLYSVITITCITLAVSFYVYDLSGLYKLTWLPNSNDVLNIVNIHAGFDETSEIVKYKYSNCKLTVLDFYDPQKHTEVSIKRARKVYPSFPDTITTTTDFLPLSSNSIDFIFVIFSAHEIRDENERVIFFKELNRILKPKGLIYITEHLRDLPNFLAYNIGFLHFLSKKNWYHAFSNANLFLMQDYKINPFVTNFTLSKNGTTS